MPGIIAAPRPTLVMPQQLCTAFAESRNYEQRQNEYHDGTPQAGQLAQTSRRTFKLSRRLSATLLNQLYQFYLSVDGGLQPFFFYNPFEASPIGSNYDPAGTNSAGRIVVAFRNDWTQSTGLGRTDANNLELVELGAPDATTLALSGHGPHGAINSAVVTLWIEYTKTDPSSPGSAATNFSYDGGLTWDGIFVSTVDYPASPFAKQAVTYTIPAGHASLVSLMARNYCGGTLFADGVSDEMHVYDIWLTITFADTTVQRFNPRFTQIAVGNTGGVVNPNNAIDADTNPPVTYGYAWRPHFSGLSDPYSLIVGW